MELVLVNWVIVLLNGFTGYIKEMVLWFSSPPISKYDCGTRKEKSSTGGNSSGDSSGGTSDQLQHNLLAIKESKKMWGWGVLTELGAFQLQRPQQDTTSVAHEEQPPHLRKPPDNWGKTRLACSRRAMPDASPQDRTHNPLMKGPEVLGSFENSYIPENPRTPPISYISQTVIPFIKPTSEPSKTGFETKQKMCTYAQKKSLHICKVFGKKKVVFSENFFCDRAYI
ncbi:hypothetical protein LXL04_017055 [Taraxacum kok-saghyz]